MRSLAAIIAGLATLTACGSLRHRQAAAPARPEAAPSERALPRSSGVILLMGLDMPDAGTVFGGHYAGGVFDVRQFGYQLTDAVRERWRIQAAMRGEVLLRGAGFQVRRSEASSSAQPLFGVQYGLSGRVTELAVQSTGPAEPYRVEAQVEVAWELLDLGSGTAVFGRSMRQVLRETGTVDSIVGVAIDGTLLRLLSDPSFRYALAQTRSDPDAGARLRFARELPAPGTAIEIATAELNPATESTVLLRIAAGVVALRSPDHVFGTAFILTRDGLALTSARSVRNPRRLRARMPNGVERPVRVLRTSRGLDVALIQIACDGDCETVDWEMPAGVAVFTNIVVIGAPLTDQDSIGIAFGRVGGRWGMASGVTLEVPDGSVAGGEPVARTASGRVFALVSSRPGRRTAVLLSEVLGALKVRRT